MCPSTGPLLPRLRYGAFHRAEILPQSPRGALQGINKRRIRGKARTWVFQDIDHLRLTVDEERPRLAEEGGRNLRRDVAARRE